MPHFMQRQRARTSEAAWGPDRSAHTRLSLREMAATTTSFENDHDDDGDDREGDADDHNHDHTDLDDDH